MSKKIILGTANFENKYGSYSKKRKLNKSEISKILNIANKISIKEIDTSYNYGKSEKIIKNIFNVKRFHKWKINTKIDRRYLKKNHISEKNLNKITDKFHNKLNIILAHNTKDLADSKKYLKIFNSLKRKKIKVGYSVYDLNETYKAIKILKPDTIQVPINILDKRFTSSKFLKLVKKYRIVVQARSIFLQGLLFQKKSIILKKSKLSKYNLKKLMKISEKLKLNLAELSLLYVNSLPFVNKIVIGVENVSHLKSIYKLLHKHPKINSKLFADINNLSFTDKKLIDPRKW